MISSKHLEIHLLKSLLMAYDYEPSILFEFSLM